MECFDFMRDRVWKKLNGWKDNLLPRGGKEVLLKSIIQSIPTYIMSLFQLPKELCDELEVMMNKFW